MAGAPLIPPVVAEPPSGSKDVNDDGDGVDGIQIKLDINLDHRDDPSGSESEDLKSLKTITSTASLAGSLGTLQGPESTIMSLNNRIQKIRVRLKHRTKEEFGSLYLIQQLSVNPDSGEATSTPATAVYSMKFSPDGTFLAAGFADGIIRVWRNLCEEFLVQQEISPDVEVPRQASILSQEPCQFFIGHEGEVVDLSWSSSNNFLLSASTDASVRLWHPSKSDCLGIFPHKDIVTSVAFHPKDDRLFVSGSFDCRVRLWSVEDRKVKAWNELPLGSYVSAVSFTANGKFALAGSSSGVLLLFETQGFKYFTQILIKSNKGGRKIASISCKPGKEEDIILVSSNDSKIRTFSLRDKSLLCKYKGHLNDSSQIGASFSHDSEYIISGSEDGRCVVWPVEGRNRSTRFFSKSSKDRNDSFEYFQVSSSPTTVAVFAPSRLVGRLQSCHLRPTADQESGKFAEGHVIAVADVNGRIRLFENNSQLEGWINPG